MSSWLIFFILATFVELHEGYSLVLADALSSNNCEAKSPLKIERPTPQDIELYKIRNNLKHPHQVICCLSKNFRSNYVIVTESFSAQGGAEEFKKPDGSIDPKKIAPRVILFTPGGPRDPIDLSISFNGLKSQRNHMNLEMMTFEKKPKDEVHHGFFDYDFDENYLSKKNPDKCLACHGRATGSLADFKNARPRWDSNPFWPRTFGSDPIEAAPFRLTSFEKSNRMKFAEEVAKMPGYKCLENIEENLIHPLGMTDLNTEYSLRIAAGNQYRVADMITKTEDYTKYRYAILGALIGCHGEHGSIESFLPSEIRAKHKNTDFLIDDLRKQRLRAPDIEKVITRATEHHLDNSSEMRLQVVKLMAQAGGDLAKFAIDSYFRQGAWTMETSVSIAGLRYLLEGRGIYMGDYSADVTEGRYRFNSATRFGRSEAIYIAKRLIDSDRTLRDRPFSREVESFISSIESLDVQGIQRLPSKRVVQVSVPEQGPNKACEQLKNLSLSQFTTPGSRKKSRVTPAAR